MKYKDLNIYLLRDSAENHTLKALNIPSKKVVLPGRVKCGGTEGEIVVSHGIRERKTLICGTEGEIVVAHCCPKRKKLICGAEGEIVVAHGRLPPPRSYYMPISGCTVVQPIILPVL